MNIEIVATRYCSHCQNMERALRDLGVPYDVLYAEDYPELTRQLGIRGSPNLVVDRRLIFHGQQTSAQLKQLLNIE